MLRKQYPIKKRKRAWSPKRSVFFVFNFFSFSFSFTFFHLYFPFSNFVLSSFLYFLSLICILSLQASLFCEDSVFCYKNPRQVYREIPLITNSIKNHFSSKIRNSKCKEIPLETNTRNLIFVKSSKSASIYKRHPFKN